MSHNITPSRRDRLAALAVLCSGVSTLTAAGNFANWQWSNGQNGPTDNIMVNSQGNFTVTVTDANGCTGTDTHTVTER